MGTNLCKLCVTKSACRNAPCRRTPRENFAHFSTHFFKNLHTFFFGEKFYTFFFYTLFSKSNASLPQQFWGFSQSVISLVGFLPGKPVHSGAVVVYPSNNGAGIFLYGSRQRQVG